MTMIRQRLLQACCFALVLTSGVAFSSVQAASEIRLWQGQTVYVPIYSHIYSGDREHPFYLTATLSIRNTDPAHPITIISADYHDSDGKLIRSYLDRPVQLRGMASTRYVVRESDKSGGSGASFVVRWKADAPVSEPVIQGIMIGTKSQQGISFITDGKVIREHKQ